jgi:dipeptidyl aminopeptidase/acylaminoacyl peptidase
MCAAIALVAIAPQARAEKLVDVTEIARGDYMAPRLSPDGAALLVTGTKYRGLVLVDVDRGSASTLVTDDRAGVSARFLGSGQVLFAARRAGALRPMVVDRDGGVRAATARELGGDLAIARGDRVYVRDPAGQLRAAATGDRFFAPLPSPTGEWVAFQGLATGLYLYRRRDAALVHVGRGTAPAWSPSGDRLIFERTEDDGHAIVGSDLYLYDVDRAALIRLTRTAAQIERRPSFGPNGTAVVFDDDRGVIYGARLEDR